MADSAYDKTIPATPHRRQQAREQGHVAQSHDLVAAGLLIAGLATLLAFGGRVVEFFIDLIQRQVGGEAWLSADADFTVEHWYAVLLELAQVFAPMLGLLAIAAIAMHVVQFGLLWNPERVAPDVRRISPLAGLQRIFSAASGVRLTFGLLKAVVVMTVAFWSLYHQGGEILEVAGRDVSEIGAFLVHTLLWTSVKIGIALVVLALADYGYQRWRHERDLRMTPQELREEMRNLQGDPQLPLRRRAVQRDLAAARLAAATSKADLVVTSGNVLAVALRYNSDTMDSPTVVAKGTGALADRIRQSAMQHGVTIVDRKSVAQALYRQVGLIAAVPEPLYAPVAELLATIYRQQGKSPPRSAAA